MSAPADDTSILPLRDEMRVPRRPLASLASLTDRLLLAALGFDGLILAALALTHGANLIPS